MGNPEPQTLFVPARKFFSHEEHEMWKEMWQMLRCALERDVSAVWGPGGPSALWRGLSSGCNAVTGPLWLFTFKLIKIKLRI